MVDLAYLPESLVDAHHLSLWGQLFNVGYTLLIVWHQARPRADGKLLLRTIPLAIRTLS